MGTTQTESTVKSDTKMKLELDNVSKHFGRVVAVEDVSFSVAEGEIFALVGDNGAGKSTLLNIISGVYRPTAGALYYEGDQVSFSNPSDARNRGIETVYQDLALMGDLDVATNLYMGKFPTYISVGPLELIDWSTAYEQTEEMLEYLGQDINPRSEVAFLSGGQRQLIAIGRAISFDPDVLVLDEPTSALSIAGAELVHETMEQLRDDGHTQIVVSHSIEDVYQLADRIGVMYQGELVEVVNPDDTAREVVTNLIKTGQRTDPER